MDRGESIRVMHPLFQADQGGSIPTSPLQLRIVAIPFDLAKALNRQWHRTLPRFGTGFCKTMPFLCYGAVFEDKLYAVAIWSNPAARNLPQQTWLELRRFAVADDAPTNCASRMLKVMRFLIRRARPDVERLISYQDIGEHSGTIYKVAGWVKADAAPNADRGWDRPNRSRPKSQGTHPVQRWEKGVS